MGTVYDSDIGKDSIEGSYSFPIRDAIQMSGKEGSWYDLTGCKSGKILISSTFAKNDAPSVGDDVDGPSSMNEEICDNEEVIDEKSVEFGQNKMEIPSIRKEGENIDDSIDEEDTDKQDDDVSESDYSYVTVADLSRKEDISQSEADDQNKLPKDMEVKPNDENSQEDESPSKETPKGFMASIKDTVGGYFYSDKSPKEDIKEEEQGSQDLVSSEKEGDKPDPHVPREFLMQPTSQDANSSSSSLTKKQPINLKDDNETIMEEAEPVEETAEETLAVVTMKSSQSDTPKEEPKEEKKKDDSLKKKAEKEPAVVEMVTCHSEALHEEQKDEKNETPAVVEMVTCHSDVVDTETTEGPSSPTKSEANMKESKINLPFSPTSVQPREPYPQSEKSCDDDEDEGKEDAEAVKEVKKVLNQDYRQQILEGTEGIETIINNLFVVLGELSKSVGCQKSITDIKKELESFKQASTKISKDLDSDKSTENKTNDAGENLSSIVREVKESITKSKNFNAEEKASTVDAKEFDKLLINCQELLMDLESITGKQDKTQTPPSTPEEFHDAKEAISASASFASKKDVEKNADNAGNDDPNVIDDVDGSSLTKSKPTEDAESNSKPEAAISFVAHQVKSFDDQEGDDTKEECEVEESESMNVSSKANTEGIGKLRTKMIEETVSSESTMPNQNGLTQTISQTVTRTVTTISDTPLPETNGEPSVEST